MPTIYCITNEVSANFVANALLAVGASPIMSSAFEEVEDLCKVADALLLNIGTPSSSQFATMLAAGKRMHALGKPIVLDPVGVNTTHYRLQMAQQLIKECHPAVIRGNASEILALAQNETLGTGLDNSQLSDLETSFHTALPIVPPRAKNFKLSNNRAPLGLRTLNSTVDALARQTEAVIVVSGPVDYITDGVKTASVALGSPTMALTTGTGCVASAIIAAYITLLTPHASHPFEAALKAMTLMGQAGEDMSHFLERLSSL